MVGVAVWIGACVAGLGGCAVEEHHAAASDAEVVPNEPYSGFLKDYSGLRPSPTHAGAFYEQSEALARYSTFMVDPVQVLAKETVRGTPIDAETAAGLAEVTLALPLSGFKVVGEPGPGVARIRAAVTRLARSRHEPGKPGMIGGGEIEVEIVDSVSGQRLGAAVEHDDVSPVDAKATDDPYSDVRLVFHHWSARMGVWLRQVRGE
jgi:hypothetical protein